MHDLDYEHSSSAGFQLYLRGRGPRGVLDLEHERVLVLGQTGARKYYVERLAARPFSAANYSAQS